MQEYRDTIFPISCDLVPNFSGPRTMANGLRFRNLTYGELEFLTSLPHHRCPFPQWIRFASDSSLCTDFSADGLFGRVFAFELDRFAENSIQSIIKASGNLLPDAIPMFIDYSKNKSHFTIGVNHNPAFSVFKGKNRPSGVRSTIVELDLEAFSELFNLLMNTDERWHDPLYGYLSLENDRFLAFAFAFSCLEARLKEGKKDGFGKWQKIERKLEKLFDLDFLNDQPIAKATFAKRIFIKPSDFLSAARKIRNSVFHGDSREEQLRIFSKFDPDKRLRDQMDTVFKMVLLHEASLNTLTV